MMDLSFYQCPNCKGEIRLSKNNRLLICTSCSSEYNLIDNSIPVFTSTGLNAEETGLATKLFNSPLLYRCFVNVKRVIAPDDNLDISRIVENSTLLNVGCGSNIDAPHLEYDLNQLNFFGATDLSLPFVVNAKKNCTKMNTAFAVSSIDNLPYRDDSFDVVIVPFVLHHLPFSIALALREIYRVSKRYVIVFDHIKADLGTVWSKVQEKYWHYFDGGYQYLTEQEWNILLKEYHVKKSIRTGALGKHVTKFIIEKQ